MGRKTLHHARTMGLFAIGITLGVFGVTSVQSTPLPDHDLQAWSTSDTKSSATPSIAMACTPKESSDDIFFISCGGIY